MASFLVLRRWAAEVILNWEKEEEAIMKKQRFFVVCLVVLAIMVLGYCLAQAKDVNNLDQYDPQVIADILGLLDNFCYPLAKEGWGGWKKIDQYGQPITSEQRLISLYYMLSFLYQQKVEAKFVNLVNDSSCGDESTVDFRSWQIRMFGGLPYVYFLSAKGKLKIERASLQSDFTAMIKNIVCSRNVTGLDGVAPGQEEYVKSILTATFPEFVWGNVVWNPDKDVPFGVEVSVVPAKYLNPPVK